MTDLAQLLPQQSIANTIPQSLQTSGDITTQLNPVALPAFSPLAGMPGVRVVVDPTDLKQPFYGVGGGLTDSTCYVLTKYCTPAQRKAILTRAFLTDNLNTARICMGSSDFSARGFYYDLTQAPTYDPEYIIPVLLEALAINPRLKIIASCWSPPASMKGNSSLLGGTGATMTSGTSNANLSSLAGMFVTWIQLYQSYGIPIWAVTTQNEGGYSSSGYPGCLWTGAQVDAFVPLLGAAIDAAGLETRIWIGDFNAYQMAAYSGDLVSVPLADATAAAYVDGVAWHGYDLSQNGVSGAGVIEARDIANHMRPYPSKASHFTEWSTFPAYDPNARVLLWGACTHIIEGIRIGKFQSLTFWNLFLDPGGTLTGANSGIRGCASISIDGNATQTLNPEYILLAHLGRYLKPGARVCGSTTYAVGRNQFGVQSVAFVNPDGSVVVFLYNSSATTQTVMLVDAPSGLATPITLAPGSNGVLSGNSQTGGGSGVCCASLTYTPPAKGSQPQSFVAPGPVAALTATGANGVSNLSWTAPASAGTGPLGGYAILRGTASGGETRTVGVALPGATSFTDNDVSTGTPYYYNVIPFGAGGPCTSGNPETSCTPTASAPSAPTVSVQSGLTPIISLVSAPSNSGGSTITGYNIYRGTASGGEASTPVASNVSLPYTDTGATAQNSADAAYYYTAAAVNSTGAGAQSSEVSGTAVYPGAGWTPASIQSALAVWLDASHPSTVQQSSGPVSAWASLVNGVQALQPAAGNQPTYSATGRNSRPAITFNGANTATTRTYLALNNTSGLPSGSAAAAMSAVGEWASATASQYGSGAMGFGHGVANAQRELQCDANGHVKVSYYGSNDYATSVTWLQTDRIVYVDQTAGASPVTTISIDGGNGVAGGSGSTTPFTSTGTVTLATETPGYANIGNDPTPTQYLGASWNGPLQEVIYLNRQLTTTERQKLEGYLAWKWGLQSHLPSSHPYASAAPTS